MATQPDAADARERPLLQIAVAVCGLVPVAAGFSGVMLGLPMIEAIGDVSADNH